jgi:hypothetical protein
LTMSPLGTRVATTTTAPPNNSTYGITGTNV